MKAKIRENDLESWEKTCSAFWNRQLPQEKYKWWKNHLELCSPHHFQVQIARDPFFTLFINYLVMMCCVHACLSLRHSKQKKRNFFIVFCHEKVRIQIRTTRFLCPRLINNNNNKQKQPVKHYCLVLFLNKINKMYQNNPYALMEKMQGVKQVG